MDEKLFNTNYHVNVAIQSLIKAYEGWEHQTEPMTPLLADSSSVVRSGLVNLLDNLFEFQKTLRTISRDEEGAFPLRRSM